MTMFKSFLIHPLVQKFIEEPNSGYVLNFNQEEKLANEDTRKTWPDTELIFGEDLLYQGCITDIMSNVKEGMSMVEGYVKVSECWSTPP